MAKDKKSKNGHDAGHDAGRDAGHDAVTTALAAPDAPAEAVGGTAPASAAPVPPTRATAPRTAPEPTPAATTPARPADGPPRGLADDAVSAVTDVARVVRTVLPNRVPAYLGGAALLVLGVVDLPAVAGGALAYEAIRRWRPAR